MNYRGAIGFDTLPYVYRYQSGFQFMIFMASDLDPMHCFSTETTNTWLFSESKVAETPQIFDHGPYLHGPTGDPDSQGVFQDGPSPRS